MLSAKVYHIDVSHPAVDSVGNHSQLLFHLHCVIKLFSSWLYLLNFACVQCAQCIHMQVWKELLPVNLVVATCDSCKRMTIKLVPRSIIVCSMGPSAARGVKITRVCWPSLLWTGTRRQQLMVWCSQPPNGKIFGLLSGVPDYFGRNKISSGGDLSHYSSASLY